MFWKWGSDEAEPTPHFETPPSPTSVSFPSTADPDTDRQAWGPTAQLAIRHRLTFNDAAYLELAKRRALPLATLEADLRAAGAAEGITLLESRDFEQ
jgi:hypothetical protein